MILPTVSVCLATYNGERYLREQIDSILPQLSSADELVVSDDGSVDSTPEILRSYGEHLRIVGQSRVGGVVPNFERALRAAGGDWIVLADQDDVWLPQRLERLREQLTKADLVLSNAEVVDASLNRSGQTLFDQLNPTISYWRNLQKNAFVGCCMAFRRSLLDRALPFPADTPWHDWLIALLGCAEGRVKLIDEPLLLYRRHVANVSATGGRSANSTFTKLGLRLRVMASVAVCLFRKPAA